jgi:ferredoxin
MGVAASGTMLYVITERCDGICDTACVDVCPVDCIAGPMSLEAIRAVPPPERRAQLSGLQLYIDPAECIGCSCCVPVCPVGAIFESSEVPPESAASAEANARFFARAR